MARRHVPKILVIKLSDLSVAQVAQAAASLLPTVTGAAG
jgi:hypothetical protein